jgi:hypothetical protein
MAGIADADAMAATSSLRFIFFPFLMSLLLFPRGLNVRPWQGEFQFAQRRLFRRSNRFRLEMRNKSLSCGPQEDDPDV